jgi:hypothetical protein
MTGARREQLKRTPISEIARWIEISELDGKMQAAERLKFDRCAILFGNALGDRVPPLHAKPFINKLGLI